MVKPLFIVIILSLMSCSLDYSDSDLTDSLSEEIPNTIIFQYETVEIHNGSPLMQIKAEKAEVYNSKEETHLTDVKFYNYKDDEKNSSGKSDFAILHMKSGDAELTGSIEIISEEDNSSLEATSLFWIDGEKTLTSETKDPVTVIDKDGSALEGRGFSANIKRKTILFDNEIKGEFISHDEN